MFGVGGSMFGRKMMGSVLNIVFKVPVGHLNGGRVHQAVENVRLN